MIPNLTPSTKCKECKSRRQRGAARSGSGIKFKLLKSRPSRLQTVPRAPQETDSESEDDWIGNQKDRQEESEEDQEEHEQEVGVGEENEEAAGEAQNSSPIAHRTRNKTDRSKQPSPRERKKRKVQAMKRDKAQRSRGGLETGLLSRQRGAGGGPWKTRRRC